MNLQTEPESGVRPDLRIHNAAGLLGGQDQMNSKASADARSADQFFHKFRLIHLQLCKLIHNKNQMRKRNPRLTLFIKPDIGVNMIDPVFCKQLLSLSQLRLDGKQRTVDLSAVNIGDRSHQMRKIFELIHHAAAFKVNNDKSDFIRVKQHCHGQNITLQNLRFTRSGSTRHQPVRTMMLLIQVQADDLILGTHAQRCSHAVINLRRSPVLLQINILRAQNIQKLEQRNILCQRSFQTYFITVNRRQLLCKPPGCLILNLIIIEFTFLQRISRLNHLSVLTVPELDHRITVIRQEICIFFKEQETDPKLSCLVDESGNGMSLQALIIVYKDYQNRMEFFSLRTPSVQFFIEILK